MFHLNPTLAAVAGPFGLAFVLSLAIVPLCRLVAHRLGYVAPPRKDRWHHRPRALFGGVAIATAVSIGLVVFGAYHEIGVLLACAGLMFLIGLADDILSFKPFTKLVLEIAIASVFLFFGYRLHWTTSLTLDTMLTLVWVVGMTNAFNLLDNMDGLCAGIALIVGTALLVGLIPAAAGTEAFYQTRYLALLLGAIAGFLVYNVHPASIFMGDGGSLPLGLSFAALALTHAGAAPARSNPLSIVIVPVLVLLIPIFDTTLVTASRILSGRAPSEGGRDHSSHRLVAVGLSERAAVALLWCLAALGGVLGIGADQFNLTWSGPAIAVFLLAMVIFAAYLARIRVYEDDQAETLDRAKLTPLVVDFMYKQQVAEVLLDLCLVTTAYYTAYRLRFEGPDFGPNFRVFYASLPLVLAVQMLALFGVGIYRGAWRYFGLMDTVGVAKGVVLGAVGAEIVLLALFGGESYSRTVPVIYAALLAILLTASRTSFRLIGEFLHRSSETATRVVVYGAGDGGALAVRELTRPEHGRHRILGFIDDDPRKQRLRVQGHPVLGGYVALVSLVSNGVVDSVVISSRLIDIERMRHLEELCADHHVSLSRLYVGLESVIATERRVEEPSSSRRSAR